MTDSDVEYGRLCVQDGTLAGIRQRLGLSQTAMAELLYVSGQGYRVWETNPFTRLRRPSAERVGRFCRLALIELTLLGAHGIPVDELLPIHMAALVLSVPQDILLRRAREGTYQIEDLGVLGLWVRRDSLGGQ